MPDVLVEYYWLHIVERHARREPEQRPFYTGRGKKGGTVGAVCWHALQLLSFADMDGEETFDPAALGYAEEVVEEKVSDDTVLLLKGMKTTKAVSTAGEPNILSVQTVQSDRRSNSIA